MPKLQANLSSLTIAGSETTATALSGVTYLLLANPDKLEVLTAEVRSSFRAEGEMDFASVSGLPYMLACLNEAMRLYATVPGALPRITPGGGAEVCGGYVAGNVSRVCGGRGGGGEETRPAGGHLARVVARPWGGVC